jgi:hypothetical protein
MMKIKIETRQKKDRDPSNPALPDLRRYSRSLRACLVLSHILQKTKFSKCDSQKSVAKVSNKFTL